MFSKVPQKYLLLKNFLSFSWGFEKIDKIILKYFYGNEEGSTNINPIHEKLKSKRLRR